MLLESFAVHLIYSMRRSSSQKLTFLSQLLQAALSLLKQLLQAALLQLLQALLEL